MCPSLSIVHTIALVGLCVWAYMLHTIALIYVCVHGHVSAPVGWTYIDKGQGSILYLPFSFSTVFLVFLFHWTWDLLVQLEWLTRRPRILLVLPQLWDYRYGLPSLAFLWCGCWGSELGSSCSSSRHFTNWAIPLVPRYHTFMWLSVRPDDGRTASCWDDNRRLISLVSVTSRNSLGGVSQFLSSELSRVVFCCLVWFRVVFFFFPPTSCLCQSNLFFFSGICLLL